jgi:hypothetical protein
MDNERLAHLAAGECAAPLTSFNKRRTGPPRFATDSAARAGNQIANVLS